MQSDSVDPWRMADATADETRDLKPDESSKERVDRELIELLNELRIALPGVQVLFAFLLVLPFQQGFSEVEDVPRHVYFVALMACALASALLIAPSVYHRLNFRRRSKEQMIHDANLMAVLGTAFVAIGIACAIFLVTDVVYGTGAAIVATVIALLVYAGLWWALPLFRRGRPDEV